MGVTCMRKLEFNLRQIYYLRGKIKFKTNYNKKSNFVIKILEIELEANLNVTQFHNVITHVVYDNSC